MYDCNDFERNIELYNNVIMRKVSPLLNAPIARV